MKRRPFTADSLLVELRARGARRLVAVRFRANRSTIWSLTRNATVLNLHAAFQAAPPAIVDAFVTIARSGGVHSRAVERASRTVESWPPLSDTIERLRDAHEALHPAGTNGRGTRCCATPRQKEYMRALYDYFNQTRFDGALPPDIPVRLSNRMTTSLGHMLPGADAEGKRRVEEIALSADLMLPGNGAERVDTLLHEMAHAADYLFDGNQGHGPSWRRWAQRAGCIAQTVYDKPVYRRRRLSDPVSRVPPLPRALKRRSA